MGDFRLCCQGKMGPHGGELLPRHIPSSYRGRLGHSYRLARAYPLGQGDRRGWEPPGGQVELGEDLVDALKREILEESGVEVEAVKLVGVYSNLGRPERGLAEQVNFAFRCVWVGGEPCAGDECTEAGWFEADEARRMVKASQQSAKLEDAVADAPEVRYQTRS